MDELCDKVDEMAEHLDYLYGKLEDYEEGQAPLWLLDSIKSYTNAYSLSYAELETLRAWSRV